MVLNPDNTRINELVGKIKFGNHEAFQEFFCLHNNEVYQFIYRHVFDRSVAEDLTQDTFIRFWEARKRIDEQRYPKAYLFKIARNLAFNYSTRTKKNDSFDESLQCGSINHYQKEMMISFLVEDVKRALNKLPDKCRSVFILSRYHNFKYEEIAEVMEISLQTVKNHMSKALSILRNELKTYL